MTTPPTSRVRARRALLRSAYRAAQAWWFVRRPHTHGVKLVLRSGGDVLLVRHSYGRREAWELPGGGVRRREAPAEAARREAREELGVDLADWRSFGAFEDRDRAVAHLQCLTTDHDGTTIRIDPVELEEARWWPSDALPHPLGHLAARALDLARSTGSGPVFATATIPR